MPQDSSQSETQKGAFKPPVRPNGLRATILILYGVLAVVVCSFALTGHLMKRRVPDGMFAKKDGTLISLDNFDPIELGPYPKCHPHHGEYEQVNETGAHKWVKIKDAPSRGPFPPGHPENLEFLAKMDAETKRTTREEMFTWKGLQPSLHLLSLAFLCVFLGAKHSVWLFTETKQQNGETRADTPALLKNEEAYWFPIMGSVMLFGLFVIYKYLGSNLIKLLISSYIVLMCMLAFGFLVGSIVDVIRAERSHTLFRVPMFELALTKPDIAGVAIGVLLALSYLRDKNWIINNIFGISFCLSGLKYIGTSTFKTGAIILVGLFVYDIFWVFGSKPVFGSNVMVTVAKGVEAPIKLMFPRSLNGCGDLTFSMLGLGDIVVPGLFITFLAKWDAELLAVKKATSFIYLNICMIFYTLSLITTVAVMLFFNAAQPALFYIVPYVLLASMALATLRGETRTLWDYELSEDSNVGQEAKDK